jgi:hypothetical protein
MVYFKEQFLIFLSVKTATCFSELLYTSTKNRKLLSNFYFEQNQNEISDRVDLLVIPL